MKRPPNADAARAAAYALGMLPDDQRATFEERLAASPALRAEVESLRATAGELALAAEPVAPRPEVRSRLLATVAAQERRPASAPLASPAPTGVADLMFALESDAVWQSFLPGVERRELARAASGASYLVRLAPGAAIPPHDHRRIEHSYVLSGSVVVEGKLCHPGDYHRAAAGTHHEPVRSAAGCVMLVIEASA